MSFLASVEYFTRTVYLPFFFCVKRYRDVKIGFLIVHPSFIWMIGEVMLEIEHENHSFEIKYINVTSEQQYIFYFCDSVNFALRVEEFSFSGNHCIYNIT